MEPAKSVKNALLLVNLGTPDQADAESVRRYLAEFLMDPRVVAIPRFIWSPLLNRVILPKRCAPVAEKYAGIWMDGGSPLKVLSEALTAKIAQRLPDTRVALAMRYGSNNMDTTIARLYDEGMRAFTVLPLYPQYSTTTTASVEDRIHALAPRFAEAQFKIIADYHDHPAWVQAVADQLRAHHRAHGRADKLMFSFHGIPAALVRKGDPYATHCEAGTRKIARAAGLPRDDITLTYQSRFGRAKWLEPFTVTTLEEWGRAGVKTVDVICPGFAVDCLETLEEIADTNAEIFKQAGGERLNYIPCLNDSDAHADALVQIAREAQP